MQRPDLVQLVLTCHSWQEADRVGTALLAKGLIGGVETLPAASLAIHEASRTIRLIMHTATDLVTAIEAELGGLMSSHTYELQALTLTPITH